MKLTKAQLIQLKRDDETANVEIRMFTGGPREPMMIATVDFKQFPGFSLVYFFDVQDEVWKLLKM